LVRDFMKDVGCQSWFRLASPLVRWSKATECVTKFSVADASEFVCQESVAKSLLEFGLVTARQMSATGNEIYAVG